MKISEYKNEEAVDVFIDLIEPVATILADEDLRKAVEADKPKISLVKTALKNHKKEVIEVLAIIDGTPVEEYECNVPKIIKGLLEILNDEELVGFFSQQGQTMR